MMVESDIPGKETHPILHQVRRQRGNRYPKPRPYIGWDTETCRGDVGMIGGWEPNTEYSVWCPNDPPTPEQACDILFKPDHYGVWWNLGYDVECLFKSLPEIDLYRLMEVEDVDVGSYTLRYIPGKKLTIRKGNGYSHHFDAAQFFMCALSEAAERFLDEHERKGDVDREEMGSTWGVWDRDEIEPYCINDARLTQRLMSLWDGWALDFGINASYPLSTANVAGRHASSQGWPQYLATHHNGVGIPAYHSYYGGRFEMRVKGWDEYQHADIRSAYPAEMVQLPDPSGSWTRTHSERTALTAPWGFVEIRAWVHDKAQWSPIMARKKGLVYGPVGGHPRKWITLDEYRACLRDPNTSVEFIKAWTGPDDGTRPLKWLAELYRERARLKQADDPRQLPLKIVMNSVYGKMFETREPRNKWLPLQQAVEEHDFEPTPWNIQVDDEGETWACVKIGQTKMGPMFNPMWASTVTARTRLRLWEAVEQGYDVCLMATDGILVRGDKLPPGWFGPNLGDWETDGTREGVIIGNGIYELEGKRPKRRGFGRPHAGWRIIDDLREGDPQRTNLQITYQRPLHPKEVMRTHGYKPTDIGAFTPVHKGIDFNNDKKRSFKPVTAGELLEGSQVGKCLMHH